MFISLTDIIKTFKDTYNNVEAVLFTLLMFFTIQFIKLTSLCIFFTSLCMYVNIICSNIFFFLQCLPVIGF
jgi:hypothetical protein